MNTLLVSSFIHPHTSPVRTATDLAKMSAEVLRGGQTVAISFVGVRGLTTSFFNMFFVALFREVPKSEVQGRIIFQFDNDRQKDACDRSWTAVK